MEGSGLEFGMLWNLVSILWVTGALSGGILVGVFLASLRASKKLRRMAQEMGELDTELKARNQALQEASAAREEAARTLEESQTSLAEATKLLHGQSLKDGLTGLPNRRFLGLVLPDDVSSVIRAYRDSGSLRALVNGDLVFYLLDIDRFEDLNRRYGNVAGDGVLVATAQALRSVVREGDLVVRWTGAALAVVARRASRGEAALLAERMRATVAELDYVPEGLEEHLHWSCSIGYSLLPFKVTDPEWLGWERVMAVADACLFVAKRSGRNAWVGVAGAEGLDRTAHGPKVPGQLADLVKARVLEVSSSRNDPFGAFHGQVFG